MERPLTDTSTPRMQVRDPFTRSRFVLVSGASFTRSHFVLVLANLPARRSARFRPANLFQALTRHEPLSAVMKSCLADFLTPDRDMLRGIARIDNQGGLLNNPLVIEGRMIRRNDHAIL